MLPRLITQAAIDVVSAFANEAGWTAHRRIILYASLGIIVAYTLRGFTYFDAAKLCLPEGYSVSSPFSSMDWAASSTPILPE